MCIMQLFYNDEVPLYEEVVSNSTVTRCVI